MLRWLSRALFKKLQLLRLEGNREHPHLRKHAGRGQDRPTQPSSHVKKVKGLTDGIDIPAEGKVVVICQGHCSISPLLSLLRRKVGTKGTGIRRGKGHQGVLGAEAYFTTNMLVLGHLSLQAGHLGCNKTYLRMSSRFYWPSMYVDVQSCPTCQKTCYVCQSDQLPVISTLFTRIAIGIVGPLVRSSGGHQYILVHCDYTTWFSEAFPLHTVTAPAVLLCCSRRDHYGLRDQLHLQTPAALPPTVGDFSDQDHPIQFSDRWPG